MVGASTPGIAAPGTRISSFLARAISAAIVARLVRQAGIGAIAAAEAASISPPSACVAAPGR